MALKSVDISNNRITDINALKALTNLESFEFANNSISDLSVLKKFSKINYLKGDNQNISIEVNATAKELQIPMPFKGIENIAKAGTIQLSV